MGTVLKLGVTVIAREPILGEVFDRKRLPVASEIRVEVQLLARLGHWISGVHKPDS